MKISWFFTDIILYKKKNVSKIEVLLKLVIKIMHFLEPK